MDYALHRLAAGSYDLVLGGIIIGSVVREISPGGDVRGWRAELLDDAPAAQRPPPFTEIEHPFRTLEAVTERLGGRVVINEKSTGLTPSAASSRKHWQRSDPEGH